MTNKTERRITGMRLNRDTEREREREREMERELEREMGGERRRKR